MDNKPLTIRLFQWLCFSHVPLTLSQLRYALAIEESFSSKSMEPYEREFPYGTSIYAMDMMVSDLFKGLATIRSFVEISRRRNERL